MVDIVTSSIHSFHWFDIKTIPTSNDWIDCKSFICFERLVVSRTFSLQVYNLSNLFRYRLIRCKDTACQPGRRRRPQCAGRYSTTRGALTPPRMTPGTLTQVGSKWRLPAPTFFLLCGSFKENAGISITNGFVMLFWNGWLDWSGYFRIWFKDTPICVI